MQISMRFLAAAAAATLLLAAACAAASDVHDELPKYGFPPGLLPDSVVSYSIDTDGKFEAELLSPCYISISNLIYYEKKIKGRLSYGSIRDIEGVQVRKGFIWFPLKGISVYSDGKALNFDFGFLSEAVSLWLFREIRHCTSKPSYRGLVAEGSLPISEVFRATFSDFFFAGLISFWFLLFLRGFGSLGVLGCAVSSLRPIQFV